jgi:hypothetical protein
MNFLIFLRVLCVFVVKFPLGSMDEFGEAFFDQR